MARPTFPPSPAHATMADSQRWGTSMRLRFLMLATLAGLAAGVLGLAGWNSGAAAPAGQKFADKSSNAMPVDTELVLAVDVSYSMDPEEQALQREGYIAALTSRE